ncbi:MAG TPA: PEP-CTERM sorting domain-containing protein [Kiritimatiellia bacterium]|nr:PEP-CTERM sorting domain-containing protein [Kiritimatiellia bacterium]
MKAILAATLFLFVGAAHADLLIGWNVTNMPGNQAFQPPAYLAENVSTGNITRGAGLSAPSVTNTFTSASWTLTNNLNSAIAANDYLSFVITAEAGYTLDLTNIAIGMSRQSTGPTNYTLRSSADGFTTDIATWERTVVSAGFFVTDLDVSGLETVEFRLYGYGTGNNNAQARVAEMGGAGVNGSLDVVIYGSVVPEPGTVVLLGIGFGVLGTLRRRHRADRPRHPMVDADPHGTIL